MTFDGVPVGPYVGIDEISRAYAERPPTDTMTVIETSPSGDVDVVRFAWDAGGTGTLRISWRDGAVSALAITFNES